jgi:hypothetical protein
MREGFGLRLYFGANKSCLIDASAGKIHVFDTGSRLFTHPTPIGFLDVF